MSVPPPYFIYNSAIHLAKKLCFCFTAVISWGMTVGMCVKPPAVMDRLIMEKMNIAIYSLGLF